SLIFTASAPPDFPTLSLHDALPIFAWMLGLGVLFLSIYTSSSSGANGTAGVSVLFGSILGLSPGAAQAAAIIGTLVCVAIVAIRSEEHTSELQSQSNLVCRLLLEKK